MLTTVPACLQPQFTGLLLTSVAMSTLKERLEMAMGKDITRAHLMAAIKRYGGTISRAALSKWFDDEKTKAMKAEHVFPVAKLCHVNPEWLATGAGKRDPTPDQCDHADIPQRRIDLIRMYGRLPDEVRMPIRSLIETLSYIGHKRKSEYLANLESANTKAVRRHMVHDK